MSDIFDAMSETTPAATRVLRPIGHERQARKSERTREAILASALAFFRDHPFRDLTVGELMARVGASRPTFYQYFGDMHELMAVLLEGVRTDILMAASPWFEGEGDPVAELKVSLAGLVDVCYQRGNLLRAVSDAAVSNANMEKAWTRFMSSFDDTVAARIEQHQAKGVIDSFPARPVAVALNRLDASLLIESFGRRPRANRDDVLAAITRIRCSTL